MPTPAAKAGKYEQLVDRFDEYEKDSKGRDTNVLLATHEKGDIVSLTAEQAEALTTGDSPAFAKPGSLAQAEADRLKAAAEAAQAIADDAQRRAKEASKQAPTSSSGATSTPSDDVPAGNASLDEWRAYALAQPDVTEESIDGKTRDELRDQFTPKS